MGKHPNSSNSARWYVPFFKVFWKWLVAQGSLAHRRNNHCSVSFFKHLCQAFLHLSECFEGKLTSWFHCFGEVRSCTPALKLTWRKGFSPDLAPLAVSGAARAVWSWACWGAFPCGTSSTPMYSSCFDRAAADLHRGAKDSWAHACYTARECFLSVPFSL